MPRALDFYHRLPPWGQSFGASLRGWQLQRRRYGPESARLIDEALERDTWSADRLRAYQQQRLEYILDRAARLVPHYRELWSERRRRGDRRSWLVLENWPLLSKEELRKRPEMFVADDQRLSHMSHDRTSGTTGTPLKLFRSRRTVRARYAIYDARHRGWYQTARDDPWAMAGGQLVVSRERARPPFWVWNRPMRQLYISSCHLSPSQARASLAEMTRRGCRYLWGYPSSIQALAGAAVEVANGSAPNLAVVVTNAEPLLPSQRRVIEQAFDCPVRETYGMVELVAAAGECNHGTLHLFPEFGWMETPDESGEIVATSLLDQDMPLVRYRTGDHGAVDWVSNCACGRQLPSLRSIEGRSDDLLLSTDGRPVGRLDPVFKSDAPIRQAQIVQLALDRILIRFVPAPGFGSDHRSAIERELQQRLGPVKVDFEPVQAIPRSPNGKFRAVISELNQSPKHSEAA